MIKALSTASTGMDAQQIRIAVIANNIANVNTTGFKTSRAEFQDLIYETVQAPGGDTASGVSAPMGFQVGSGTGVVGTQNLFTQGTMEQTNNSLDVAIEGKGFIAVQLPTGETAYTRAGSLSINASGQLVNQNGFPLVPAVTLQTNGIERRIGIDGTVTSRVPPATAPTSEGTIGVWTFPNDAGLKAVGRNLYQETPVSGTPTQGTAGTQGAGTLRQGFLESSNVNIAEELIKMILAQRAYELNGKVISTSDQMLGATSQLR
jgi:flagellar basal-body rod protein FlgG